MKKIFFIIFICITLFLSFSFNSFALGNDWSFNSNYYTTALLNSNSNFYTLNGSVYNDTSRTISNAYLKIGGTLAPNEFIYRSFSQTETSQGFYDFGFGVPMNFTVEPNQTVNFQFVIAGKSAYSALNIDNYAFRLRRSNDNVFMNLSSSNYVSFNSRLTSIVFGHMVSNGSVEYFQEDFTQQGFLVDLTYTNTNDTSISFNMLALNLSVNEVGGFLADRTEDEYIYYGFFSTKDTNTILPSYVEENLISIGNELKLANDRLLQLISEVQNLSKELEDIKASLGASSTVTNNYYEQVLKGDPEVIERQEAIAEELIQAKREADQIIEELAQVENYKISVEQIGSISTNITGSLDDYMASGATKSLFSIFFENSLIMGFLLSAFSLATVSYIMFGKR